jgi:hypothetical protein
MQNPLFEGEYGLHGPIRLASLLGVKIRWFCERSAPVVLKGRYFEMTGWGLRHLALWVARKSGVLTNAL